MDISRQAMLDKIRSIKDEVDQIFLDAEHWNRKHPQEEPIDPDPDGNLSKIRDGAAMALIKEGD